MPQQEILAQATLALCSHPEIHHHRRGHSSRSSVLAAQVQLLQPHTQLATPAIATHSQGTPNVPGLRWVMVTVLPSDSAVQNSGQPLAAAAPKKWPCPLSGGRRPAKPGHTAELPGAWERWPPVNGRARGC